MVTSTLVSIACLLFVTAFFGKCTNADYIYPCYFTNYAQYREGAAKFTPNHYIPGLCTHILYAFAQIDPNTFEIKIVEHNDEELYAQVVALKKEQPELKILLSVGGASLSAAFVPMAASDANRAKFVSKSIEYLRKYEFDGIDVDWEYPEGQEQKNSYTKLIKDLREAIDQEASGERRLLLTAALPAGNFRVDSGFDVPELAKLFDYALIMTYDLHGPWEAVTGLHSGLDSTSQTPNDVFTTAYALSYWNSKGMPKNKLVLGIPIYAKGWTLSNPSQNAIGSSAPSASIPGDISRAAGTLFYIEICPKLPGATVVHEDSAKVPYAYWGNQWISYDDEKSILDKINFVKENGYGGVFVWALDMDDFGGQFCNKGKYPLIGLLSKEFSNGDASASTVVTVSSIPTEPTLPTEESEGTEGTEETESATESTTETDASTDASQEFSCPSPGLFPNPVDCNSFYSCDHGRSTKMQCPDGLVFNPEVEVCDYTGCKQENN